MFSIIVPLFIYLYMYDSEGVNERAHVPKRIRTKGLRRVITSLYRGLANVGHRIVEHAGSIQTKRVRHTQCGLNVRHPSRTSVLFAVTLSALAYQAQSTHWEQRASFDTDSFDIGIDNRCSACISGTPEDFVGELRETSRIIKGFMGAKTTDVKVGTLNWKWLDDEGKTHHFYIPNSYFVPNCGIRLLSPQHWAKTRNDRRPSEGTGCTTTSNSVTLWWDQKKYSLNVPLSKSTNVATFRSAPGYTAYTNFCSEAAITVEDEDSHPVIADESIKMDEEAPVPASQPLDPDRNTANAVRMQFDPLNGRTKILSPVNPADVISNREAELLQYHRDFGHIPFSKLQLMAKQGVIPSRLASCPIPTCSACMAGIMSKRGWRDKPRKNYSNTTVVTPGELTSVDMMVSPTPGLIAQMTSILTTKRYKYATVYVDHATRLGFVYLQADSTVETTLKGKEAYERYALSHGVIVKNYHADNGIFKAKGWVEHCNKHRQGMTFAAVNAHHQNGIAERRIKQLQDQARSMLIFASSRWPDSITTALWPYAVMMANESINISPSLQDPLRRSPLHMYSKTNINISPKHYRPFGCPVYVLDPDLQASNPYHKWKPRSKPGIYLGPSPVHNRNVALVLNIETGRVSPQFHVKFDKRFHTVLQAPIPSTWQQKAGFVKDGEPSTIPASRSKRKRATSTATNASKIHKNSEGDVRRNVSFRHTERFNDHDRLADNHTKLSSHINNTCESFSLRSHDPDSRETQMIAQELHMFESTFKEINTSNSAVPGEIYCIESMFDQHNEYPELDPIMIYKSTADPDTMYHHQAMRQPDRDDFKAAMDKEIKDQMQNGNFTVLRRDSLPKETQILPTVWQMKRKRDIESGRIIKHKARLNVDGSKMKKGVHYDETYSPVANWSSIRLLLTLVTALNWHSVQIDYVQAFPQAPAEKPIYLRIPIGFKMSKGDPKDYVLRVDRNVYGQRQASRIWHLHLVDILTNTLKFKQSNYDECVFYRGNTIYLLYTDDSILAGPDKSEIDSIINEIKQAKLDITVLGDLKDFLGVHIAKEDDGRIHISQPHLIQQIIEQTFHSNAKPQRVPAKPSSILRRCSSSPPYTPEFNYKSVIGKLNYLERGSRSDISYATHQCARFTTDPKRSHVEAVRWLVKYLIGTKDKGYYINPAINEGLKVYVDADFSGNWDPEIPELDRDTARSRHGYIITYMDAPIVWKSQLQTEIALSSTESEYTGLSYALREAIPIMNMLNELKAHGFKISSTKPTITCRVFEDNSGALEMATTHKFRPRTKHINVKLHHFRDYVTKGMISVHSISTRHQLADYLTKPLKEEILLPLRRKVMGW